MDRTIQLILENQTALLDGLSDLMIAVGTQFPVGVLPSTFRDKMLKCAEQIGRTQAHIAFEQE